MRKQSPSPINWAMDSATLAFCGLSGLLFETHNLSFEQKFPKATEDSGTLIAAHLHSFG